MIQPLIHIAREGKMMGSFEAGKISGQLETGHFLPTDFYYDEEQATWIPLADWKLPAASTPPKRTDLSKEERRGGKRGRSRGYNPKSRSKKGHEPALGGWIACLFALAVAAGIWVWAQTLGDRLSLADKELTQVKQTLESLQSENETLSQLTPPNRIRAVVTYSVGNQAGLISGATVALYRREDVEKALGSRTPLPISAQTFDTDVESLKAHLPTPLALTVTDANGRVDIPIAQPGRYVLMATASKTTKAQVKSRYVWMIGFRIEDQPHSVLLLDEKNAASSETGVLEIKDVSTLDSEKTD